MYLLDKKFSLEIGPLINFLLIPDFINVKPISKHLDIYLLDFLKFFKKHFFVCIQHQLNLIF